MVTSVFFNNFKSSQEQQLLEDLVIESIRIFGQNMWYVPRKINNYNQVYGADDNSSYEQAILLEMYIKSIDGFSGDGTFLSQFGVEIRNQVVFTIAQRVFSDEVGTLTTQLRPNEGDLIYFPLNQKCFQIKYVDKFSMFYQLGGLQVWDVTTELFEYSNETINTGIPEIDSLQIKFSTNAYDWAMETEDGYIVTDESCDILTQEASSIESKITNADNAAIEQESETFIDFNTADPFSDGNI